MIRAGEEYDFVADLPVRRWPGIGAVTEQRLAADGTSPTIRPKNAAA